MNKTKKICLFNSAQSWGGGEKWHYDTATFLYSQGYDVTVFTNKHSELGHRIQKSGIPLFSVRIGRLSFLNIYKIFALKKLFRQMKFDAIILNLPIDLKVAGYAARLAGTNSIIYRRGSAIPIKNSFYNRFLFGKILTDIIANSEATKSTIIQNNDHLFPSSNIHVIYNGIDIQEYDARRFDLIYRRENNEIILGNAGRFVEQKNHIFLIKVATILKEKGIPFKLLLSGKGKLLAEIKRDVDRLGLSNNIIFTGFVENIKSIMESIDLYLLPSLWEGFGYVITEAYCSKIPVIGFNVSSNPELIIDNETGYLIDINQEKDFISQIEKLYNDKSKLKYLGQQGRKLVENRFGLDQSFEKLIQLLNL